MTASTPSSSALAERLGLAPWVLVALAALATVRGLLHDLDVLHEGTFVNLLFVVVPLIVWVAVAVLRSTRPFTSLVVTGALYGVMLGAVHVLLWDVNLAASGAEPPVLGGNLEGVLPLWLEAVLLRGAAVISSIGVGLVVGALTGVVAWGLRRVIPGLPLPPRAS